MQSAFELAREGSALAAAGLLIEEVPVAVFCPACDSEQAVVSLQEMRCPECGTYDVKHRQRPRTGNRRHGDRVMSAAETRLVQVRSKMLKHNDVVARDLRETFASSRRVRGQPGVQPRDRQDGLPGKDAVPAQRPPSRGGPGRRPGHGQRRPAAGPQRCSGAPDHHRHGLPSGSRDGSHQRWRVGTWTSSISCSWKTSATWSVRPPSTWAKTLRLVLFSVTEGEDKPLKYPTIFNTADVAVITKMDLAAAVEFDDAAARRNIQAVRPGMKIFEVSAKTGQGLKQWTELLEDRRSPAGRFQPAEGGH